MKSKRGNDFRPKRAEVIKIKTNKDWVGSFDESFSPGDRVSDEIALYFAEVVPNGLFEEEKYSQCGEPTDQINENFTYTTLIHDGTSWIYVGNCHKGEREEPEVIDHGE